MKHFYVIGKPIKHSKSPQIHEAFARQFSIDIDYQRLEADEDDFQATIKRLQQQGVTGCNITMPFKEAAYAAATTRRPLALIAEASNTLHFKDNEIIADNTDGAGLVNDIVDFQKISIKDKDILMIGAGGAVRGVLAPLLQQQPKSLTIVNRTAEKAFQLAALFAKSFGEIAIFSESLDSPALKEKSFDIIINATSASLNQSVPDISPHVFQSSQLVYDMMYADEPTAFMRFAADNGAQKVSDGLGMLVGQAAESFRLWHGKNPDILPVLKLLRPDYEGG